ncbi:hypothetical protein [Sorangium sp. So ce233]|uniref:hypothetical protein n=1 Tax=Sorangium sp. So ce233 TaxID=3133290 RepID=UPI003F64770E
MDALPPTSAELLTTRAVLWLGMLLCVIRSAEGRRSSTHVLAFDGLVLNVIGAVRTCRSRTARRCSSADPRAHAARVRRDDRARRPRGEKFPRVLRARR